jgi:hypothetical protein
MFRFGEIAIWKWKFRNPRNREIYKYLFDNHDFWFKYEGAKRIRK